MTLFSFETMPFSDLGFEFHDTSLQPLDLVLQLDDGAPLALVRGLARTLGVLQLADAQVCSAVDGCAMLAAPFLFGY